MAKTHLKSESRGRGRPPTRDGENLRDDVLTAARQVYAEYGYASCTVQRLAEAANISRPTFYKLFSDRHEVIDAVVAEANMALQQKLLRAVIAADGLVDSLRAAIDAYFNWCVTTGPIVGRIYSEIGSAESPASVHRQRTLNELVTAMQAEVANRGLAAQEPLFYDSLIRVVEHCGSQSVWPKPVNAEQLEKNKAVATSIVLSVIR